MGISKILGGSIAAGITVKVLSGMEKKQKKKRKKKKKNKCKKKK